MHHHLKNQERALNLSILISSGPGELESLATKPVLCSMHLTDQSNGTLRFHGDA